MGSRGAIVVGVVVLSALLGGCSGSDEPASTPSPRTTPIGKIDPSTVRLTRATFCDRVPDAAVRRALGARPDSDDRWGNGDRLPAETVAGSSGDVTHELGCSWTGPAGATARAWVFARPTSAEFARTLVAQAGKQPGCKAEPAAVFGTPAVLQTCTLPGGAERIRRAGLFGDTWLTCELTGPSSPELLGRTDAWCADVVSAVRTG
jgi:hypothetical protein